jgi:hypothetical protein
VFYQAARVHALAAAATGGGAADRHAARAVELLGRARRAGGVPAPAGAGRPVTDPDFAPLRTRGDFQALLLDLAFPADPFVR